MFVAVAVATASKNCLLVASKEWCSWMLILASTDWNSATAIVQCVMAIDSAMLAKLLLRFAD